MSELSPIKHFDVRVPTGDTKTVLVGETLTTQDPLVGCRVIAVETSGRCVVNHRPPLNSHTVADHLRSHLGQQKPTKIHVLQLCNRDYDASADWRSMTFKQYHDDREKLESCLRKAFPGSQIVRGEYRIGSDVIIDHRTFTPNIFTK